jgi:hypothetical protein
MVTNPLPRSEIVFDRPTLEKLLELHRVQPWIMNKQTALQDLVAECQSIAAKDLILNLLHRFRYFQLDEAQSMISTLAIAAQEKWALLPASSYFTCLSDPERASSGQVVLNWAKQSLAAKDDWQKNQFVTNCATAAKNVPCEGAIVFIDDFVGTGGSLITKTKYVRKVLADRGISNVRIFLIAMTAMGSAQNVIKSNVDDAIIGELLKRGISDYYSGQSLADAHQQMLQLEATLKSSYGKRKMPSFGFNGSEAVYSLNETSLPNNVFPIFWWQLSIDGRRRTTMFTRA